jgi:hypothetical protein
MVTGQQERETDAMAARFRSFLPPILPAALILCFLIPCRAESTTRVVAPDGSAEYVRIQDAVDASSSMDTVRVRPGTYHESLDLGGRAVSLIGEGGAEVTVVDAGGSGSALAVPFTPGGPLLVRGLTLTNGNGTISRGRKRDERCGGGVFVELAFGRFEDCRIVGNVANSGGGIYVIAGAPEFVRCVISGNSSGVGGGVSVDNDGGVLLENCEIGGNDAVFGGGLNAFRGGILLDGCRVVRNRAYLAGAIRIVNAGDRSVRVRDSLIARNVGDVAGAIHCWYGSLRVESTTIVANDSIPSVGLVLEESEVSLISTIVAGSGPGRLITCLNGQTALDCVVIWPPQAEGASCGPDGAALFADPLFCDAQSGDYTLRSDSPCIPTQGPAGCGLIGAFGLGCEVPVPVRRGSWGALRALFR